MKDNIDAAPAEHIILVEATEELDKPEELKEPTDLPPQVPVAKRRSPTCSYCHLPGHRNCNKKGSIKCPKRRKDEGAD